MQCMNGQCGAWMVSPGCMTGSWHLGPVWLGLVARPGSCYMLLSWPCLVEWPFLCISTNKGPLYMPTGIPCKILLVGGWQFGKQWNGRQWQLFSQPERWRNRACSSWTSVHWQLYSVQYSLMAWDVLTRFSATANKYLGMHLLVWAIHTCIGSFKGVLKVYVHSPTKN